MSPPKAHPSAPAAKPAKKTLARSLGEFFGILINAAKTDVTARRTVVRTDVQQQTINTPAGEVTLRRTTIDEVEQPPRTDAGPGSRA